MDFPLAEEVRGRKQAVRPLQTVPTGQPAVQKEHPVGWEGGTPGCSGVSTSLPYFPITRNADSWTKAHSFSLTTN